MFVVYRLCILCSASGSGGPASQCYRQVWTQRAGGAAWETHSGNQASAGIVFSPSGSLIHFIPQMRLLKTFHTTDETVEDISYRRWNCWRYFILQIRLLKTFHTADDTVEDISCCKWNCWRHFILQMRLFKTFHTANETVEDISYCKCHFILQMRLSHFCFEITPGHKQWILSTTESWELWSVAGYQSMQMWSCAISSLISCLVTPIAFCMPVCACVCYPIAFCMPVCACVCYPHCFLYAQCACVCYPHYFQYTPVRVYVSLCLWVCGGGVGGWGLCKKCNIMFL